jgi:hypothetical protein
MILEFRDLWSLGTCFLEILQCVAYCLFASDPCRKNSFCTFQISAWRMTDQEMQRGRDREAFLIHFTRIHRLAWPGTTRSSTAMLLCMIAPGLEGSMTVRSIRRFFPTWSIPHWFTIDAAELARNPFDNGRFTNCWNFWCQPRWPAARGLLLCHAMRSQPMFACHKAAVCHKCILYASAGMHLTHAFYKLALFKAVFNVFGPNKAWLWVGSQDAKGEFWASEELHVCLRGLNMTPWTGHVSHVPYCNVFVCRSKLWCLLTHRTGHVQSFSVKFKSFVFFLKISENRVPPERTYCK